METREQGPAPVSRYEDGPYVGPKTFGTADAWRFFGRDYEERILTARIIAGRSLLFYAQSGAGKSSLLNTRVIPGLKKEGFEVLPTGSVSGHSGFDIKTDNIYIYNLLDSLENCGKGHEADPDMDLDHFLDNLTGKEGCFLYDKNYDWSQVKELKPRVLIIDQFEEIITINSAFWQQREDFFRQLAVALENDEQLWVVLAMRQDFVAELKLYRPLLPGGLRNEYYMQQLTRSDARKAITRPVELEQFNHPFEPKAADLLLENLLSVTSEKEGEAAQTAEFVEPVQLQAVCLQLWENVKTRPGTTITVQDVETYADVDTALMNFYKDTITDTLNDTGVSEIELRNWFENELITDSGTRNMVFRGDELTGSLPTKIADYVRERFILREVVRPAGVWYELVHDRFVHPIIESNRQWRLDHPLISLAQEWIDSGKTDQALLSGWQVDRILKTNWRALGPMVTEYMEASQNAQKKMLEEEDQQRQEMERQRELAEEQRKRAEDAEAAEKRQRRLTLIAFVASVVAIALTIAAVSAGIMATINADEARRSEQRAAMALADLAEAQQDKRTTEAVNLALRSTDALGDNDFVYGLHFAYQAVIKTLAEEHPTTADASAALSAALSKVSNQAAVLQGHTGVVNSAGFSLDGERIVTTSDDGTARLWDADGQELAVLDGHTSVVNSVDFSRDGNRIVTASDDGTARLWDGGGQFLAVLDKHTSGINMAKFSEDGRRIMTASDDSTARLWDADGRELAVLEEHTSVVNSADFSHDGKHIVTASDDNTVRLWDVDGQLLVTLEGHAGPVRSADFSADGERLVSASVDGVAMLWDEEGQQLEILKGHTALVNSAVFSEDGERIVTASFDNTARLWDREGQPLAVLRGHTAPVTSAVFSADGQRIVTASDDNTARLWDREGRPLIILAGHTGQVRSGVFSPDGENILTASWDNTARLWNFEEQEQVELRGHTDLVKSAIFSPDGEHVLTASDDGTARLWDAAGQEMAVLSEHTDPINSAVFSADGERILTAGDDGLVRLWDRDGQLLAVLEGHTDLVNSAIFSPNGERILTASDDGTARLWDAAGQELAMMTDHHADVNLAIFSPDGERILTAGCDEFGESGCLTATARLWDRDGQLLAALEGHTDLVNSAIFSPDGGRILTASSDGTARLWDAAGENPAAFFGHMDHVNSAIFSPDGEHILTASDDGTARLWDAIGQELAVLEGHTKPVKSAIFSLDGERILTTSDDGTARLWDAAGQELAVLTDRRANINAAAFSPGGEVIVTASDDGAALIWSDLPILGLMVAEAKELLPSLLAPDECLAVFNQEICSQKKDVGHFVELARLLIRRGDVDGSLVAFKKALALDDPDRQVTAREYNSICWLGSVARRAQEVLPYCEKAVSLAPEAAYIRDSRGLGRALTGDYKGAIEDFQYYVDVEEGGSYAESRVFYIEELKAGRDPFTDEELAILWDQ